MTQSPPYRAIDPATNAEAALAAAAAVFEAWLNVQKPRAKPSSTIMFRPRNTVLRPCGSIGGTIDGAGVRHPSRRANTPCTNSLPIDSLREGAES